MVSTNCTIATLVATVNTSSLPVTVGIVEFFDAAKSIGQVQVVQSTTAGYKPGTASLLKALGPGAHPITAKFHGTLSYSASISASQNLVIAGSTSNIATLYQNTNFVLPDDTTRITLADINGDGLPDILAPLLGSASVAIFLNNPANPGHFLQEQSLKMFLNEPPGRVIVTDIDGDGLPDIAVAVAADESGDNDYSYGIVEVFLQDPLNLGTFKTGYVVGSDYTLPSDFSVTDMNGDGIPDVVFTGSYSNFGVTGHAVNIDYQSATSRGSFGRDSSSAYETGSAYTFNTGDLNGDGLPDIVFGGLPDQSVSVFYGDPKKPGSFASNEHFPGPQSNLLYQATFLDLDRDGHPDLVLGAVYSGLQTMRNNPSNPGYLLSPVAYAVSDRALGLGIGDVNGDGILDVVTADYSNAFSVLYGDGQGGLGTPVLYTLTGPAPRSLDELATADLDGDGFDDVVTAPAFYDGVSVKSVLNVFLHTPATPTTVTSMSLSASPTSASVGSSVMLTATLSSIYGTPGGSVSFTDGSLQLGSGSVGTNGVASLSTTLLPSGTQLVTATYSGSSTFSPVSAQVSVTITSVSAPNVFLSASPASPTVNQQVTFSATVSNVLSLASLPVSFYDNAVLQYSTLTNANGLAIWPSSGLSSGAHTITAQYQPAAGGAFTSNALSYMLLAPTTMTLTSSVSTPSISQSFNLIAVVKSATSGIPTGIVSFTIDGLTIGSASLDGTGTATIPTTISLAGAHSATAAYAGSGLYSSSMANLNFNVSQPDFTLTLSQSSLILTSGGSASVGVLLASVAGYSDIVNLSCSTLPPTLTCSFSNAAPSVSSTIVTSELTVKTTSTYGHLDGYRPSVVPIVLCFLAPFLLFSGARRWRSDGAISISCFALAMIILVSLGGCGGTQSKTIISAPSPIAITVIGKGQSSGMAHTSTLSVTFQ
jgi:hypothetical protein